MIRRTGIKAATGLIEAFGFTAVVLIDIWFLRSRTRWGDILPALFVLISFIAHRETLQSIGFAARGVWPPVLVYAAAMATSCLFAAHPRVLLARGAGYFTWCVLQQLLLQNMVYRRTRDALGPSWTAFLLAGTLFAAAHFPNPVLVPATFVLGTITAMIFERYPNIIALAVFQTLLSSLLLWLTPISLNHQFRVGPGYWRFR